MRIEYTCPDGSRTLALWPSLALLHWLSRSYPMPSVANPEPFKVYITRWKLPADDSELLLTLVYAELERRWNKTLPFKIVPPNPKRNHGGKRFQALCLSILRWLHAQGEITNLEVSSES
jgi:hypothetical protein